jgi:hypothetical protein
MPTSFDSSSSDSTWNSFRCSRQSSHHRVTRDCYKLQTLDGELTLSVSCPSSSYPCYCRDQAAPAPQCSGPGRALADPLEWPLRIGTSELNPKFISSSDRPSTLWPGTRKLPGGARIAVQLRGPCRCRVVQLLPSHSSPNQHTLQTLLSSPF